MAKPLGKHVTGLKQTQKALGDGTAKRVYIAADAEDKIAGPIRRLADERGVEVEAVGSMAELGQLCGISIAAAVAAEIQSGAVEQGE